MFRRTSDVDVCRPELNRSRLGALPAALIAVTRFAHRLLGPRSPTIVAAGLVDRPEDAADPAYPVKPARTDLVDRASPHARLGQTVLARAGPGDTTRNPLGPVRFACAVAHDADEPGRWLRRLLIAVGLASMSLAVQVGVVARAGDAETGSTRAADDLAERFVNGAPARPRLDFVPGMGGYLAGKRIPPQPVPPTGPSNAPPAQRSTSVVTIRHLPKDAKLSAGKRISPTQWELPADQLDGLVVTLPRFAPAGIRAEIALAGGEGAQPKTVTIEIRQPPPVKPRRRPRPVASAPPRPPPAVTAAPLPPAEAEPDWPLPVPLPLPMPPAALKGPPPVPSAADEPTGAPMPAQQTKVQPLLTPLDPSSIPAGPTAGAEFMSNFRIDSP